MRKVRGAPMNNQGRKTDQALAVVIVLCLAALSASTFPSQAHSHKAAASGQQTKKPLNQIDPAFVITPAEAKEWHALKDNLGPTFSGSPSWKNYMEFVEKKLK